MGQFSPSDAYRIFIPGAVVVVLTVFSLRVVQLTPRPEDQSLLDGVNSLISYIETPANATVLAITIGFVLFFLDPAYRTSGYMIGLPSNHLKERLQSEGWETRGAANIYFKLLNEDMPTVLRQRALTFGAFFRIGVLIVLATLLVGVLLPVALLGVIGTSRGSPVTAIVPPTTLGLLGFAIVGGLTAVFLYRRFTVKQEGTASVASYDVTYVRVLNSTWTPVVIVGISGVVPWLLIGLTRIGGAGSHIVFASAVASTVVWLVVRLMGPVGSVFISIRSREPAYYRNDHYAPRTEFCLDAAYAASGLVGVVVVSPVLAPVQTIAIMSMIGLGLALSFLRKHERQQHGVYRNQNAWIDRHWAEILRSEDIKAARD